MRNSYLLPFQLLDRIYSIYPLFWKLASIITFILSSYGHHMTVLLATIFIRQVMFSVKFVQIFPRTFTPISSWLLQSIAAQFAAILITVSEYVVIFFKSFNYFSLERALFVIPEQHCLALLIFNDLNRTKRISSSASLLTSFYDKLSKVLLFRPLLIPNVARIVHASPHLL